LINTGFTCNSTTTQENLITGKYVPLAKDCVQSVANATTAVTFPLPQHKTTVQINITGPYWIGAFRLCIRGNGQENMTSTLRQLDFCQLYMTPNEAIGRLTSIPIVFIKNINMTQALSTTDPTLYSGIWMPTFSTVSLSDEEYYVDFGNYLRYTSSLTILQVSVDEYPFFIKNIQQPIVRIAELIFHSLLFTSLCIELFGFGFLLVKLFINPSLRGIVYLWKKFQREKKLDESDVSAGSTSTKDDSILKVDDNQTTPLEFDSSVSKQDPREEQNRYSASDMELNAIEIVSRL
jgi:hypothetical protein